MFKWASERRDAKSDELELENKLESKEVENQHPNMRTENQEEGKPSPLARALPHHTRF